MRARAELVVLIEESMDAAMPAAYPAEEELEVPNYEWSDVAERLQPPRATHSKLVATAAAALVALVLVGTAAFASRERTVSTAAPSNAEPAAILAVAAPSEPIYGVDNQIVVVDGALVASIDCLARTRRLEVSDTITEHVGAAPVRSASLLEIGVGSIETVVVSDQPQGFETCGDPARPIWGTGYVDAYLGAPGEMPAPVVVLGGGNTGAGQFHLQGRADQNVDAVRLVDVPLEDQRYSRSGRAFRIDAVMPEGWNSDIEMQIEVLYVDGSREQQAAFVELGSSCVGDEQCLGRWLRFYFDSATEAGQQAQAAVLSDLELTQDEYDGAVGRFRECLPTGVGATVDRSGAMGMQVEACYSAHLSTIEQARVTLNAAWLGRPDVVEQLSPVGQIKETAGDAE